MINYYRINKHGLLLGQFSSNGVPTDGILIPPPIEALPSYVYPESTENLEESVIPIYTPPLKAARYLEGSWVLLDTTFENELEKDARLDSIELLKNERSNEVSKIIVTTTKGNSFNGDELSQTRMSRAILSLTENETIPWVLSNNSVIVADKSELAEALKLAGLEMANIWVKPYQQ